VDPARVRDQDLGVACAEVSGGAQGPGRGEEERQGEVGWKPKGVPPCLHPGEPAGTPGQVTNGMGVTVSLVTSVMGDKRGLSASFNGGVRGPLSTPPGSSGKVV
jgi:hypothetical protein